MNLQKSIKNEIDNDDDTHFYKEPLDYVPDYKYKSKVRAYSFFQSQKMSSLKSSKFYIFNKSKPVETMVQVDLKNFKISNQRKITEKILKNIKRTNIAIPTDELPIKNIKENIVFKKHNTDNKSDEEFLRMPKDNFLSSHKNKNNNLKNKDNTFSVILQSQVKRSEKHENINNKQYFIENMETLENRTIETSRNKHKKKKYSKKEENNQKIESNEKEEKVIKDKKEKKLKEIQIIKHENNNFEKSENSSKKEDKKEKINKEIISKNNDVNKQKNLILS